jgi:DNA-binding NarL/FixJ family response regulator
LIARPGWRERSSAQRKRWLSSARGRLKSPFRCEPLTWPRSEVGAPRFLEEVTGLARRAGISLGAKEADRELGSAREFGLTDRELEVLCLLADGRTNRQIGEQLFITPETASVHVSRILMKLGVANRAEAGAAAHRMGLVRQVGMG